MFKTFFMRRSLWSLQNFNIYIPEESFHQAVSSVTTFQLCIHTLWKLCQFKNFPTQILIKQRCEGASVCIIQYGKLWYNFPVVTITENKLFLSN